MQHKTSTPDEQLPIFTVKIHEQCRPCSTIEIIAPSYLRDKLHIDKQPLKTAQNNGVSLINEYPTLVQPTSPDKDHKDAFSASKRTDTCILILIFGLQRCSLR